MPEHTRVHSNPTATYNILYLQLHAYTCENITKSTNT